MILGTAGHIDHGKTALVRALTGVDTDRLPEEKRRGITIDLGFAPLRLSNGTTIGVVDVPGHEAFVRTMLAGATGIDVALIVIAADEGPMPQTREHLAILELLDVPAAVVALTKADLVDPDWLALVTEDVRDLLKPTPFANAAIVPTSVTTGAGLDVLRESLDTLTHADARRTTHADAGRTTHADAGRTTHADARRTTHGLLRVPVDRAFIVRGTGTVVTGTVWSGELRVDDTVRILPGGLFSRVRGLQTHGASVNRIAAGARAAIAVADVEAEAVGRGATLVTSKSWEPALVLRADVTSLQDAPELRPRTRVRFHLATADVGARVVAAGTPVAPGTSRTVRIVLDEPVVARGGDRFVLRSASPLATIGGGIVTDASAPRRSRPMRALGLSAAQRLEVIVGEAGVHGIVESVAAIRIGVDDSQLRALFNGAITLIGERIYSAPVLEDAGDRLLHLVRVHHKDHPLDSGVQRQDVRSRLGLESSVFDHLVGELVRARKLDAAGAELRLPGRAPEVSDKQRRIMDEVLGVISAAGREPPSVSELQERFGQQILSLLRHLERDKRVVQVEDGRFYSPEAVRELLQRLEQGMAGRGELAPTDLRDVLGFSRKFLIPFLEFCDRRGYTVRQGNGRVWRGQPKT